MKVILNFIQMCYQTLPSKLQRKFQSAIKQQDIFQQIKIEFSNGEVLNMNQQLPYNSIQIVSIYGFVNAVIWDFFHLENIVLLVLLIIAFTNRYSSQDQIFILAFSLDCYVIQFLLSIIMTSWCHYQRWSYQNQINKKTCIVMSQIKRLALNDGFDDNSVYPYECIEWGNLQAGTIICVQRGEQCPADLLILDSSQEEIIINHKTRHPCQATFIPINSSQKGVMIDFKINLNGSIQFNQQTNQIQGTIKLKNDPKATQFNSNNMLFRGEVLESTDWIYGMSLTSRIKLHEYNGKRQFFIVSILLNIILIPKIIYDTKTDPFYSFFDYLIIVLALLPFQVYIVDQIFVLISSIRAYITYNSKATDHEKKYQLISQRGLNEYDLIQETDKQVIIGVNKHESSGNVIIRKKSSQIQETIINITGSLQFTNNSFTNLIHTDLVVVENPENIFRRLPKVSQIVIDNNRYNINYDRVRDQVLKTSPSLKQNCDKLLINTYRSHMYDEQKTNDFELLLNEKKTPSFVQQQLESNNQGSVLKPGFFRDKSFAPKKTQLEGQKQLNPYVSFRKQSARNLFNSTNNLAANSSGGENKQFQGSPRSTYRQKSFKKSMMGQKPSVSSQSQANAPLIKEQEYLSSDRLIGDIFSEQDFYEKLISKEDTKMNEILIMMLICNDVSSYYDIHTKVIKNTYPNIYDKSIIDFAALFDYVFFHSAHVEINKPEYSTNQIIKRTISIQGIVKIFEILFVLKPTEKRPKTISVLVRDPESFHLEEGALLYTRYETNMIVDQKISQINVGQINDILHEMQWDGLQTFVYTKKQLTNEETRKIIDKMNQINDNYGYKSHEIEQFYLEQENDAQLVYLIGFKISLQGKKYYANVFK
ncbi:Adenylate cyclase type 9 [Paramecium bursaria]